MDNCHRAPINIRERPSTDFILAWVYLAMSVVGSAGNLLSLFCLFKIKCKQRSVPSDRILVGLIISDLTTSTFVLPYRVALHFYESSVLKLCLLRQVFSYFFAAFTFWSSSTMVALIAVNRYVNITKISKCPLSERRITALVVGIYMFCIFVPVAGFVEFPILALTNLFVMWGTTCVLVVLYVLIYRAVQRSRQRVRKSGGRVSRTFLIILHCSIKIWVHL
jgi:7 transmembrane receptor (rhodopsin family).